MIHHLKCDEGPFLSIQSGHKKFEYRENDRDYDTGDLLHLTTPRGDDCWLQVTYILRGGLYGVPPGYCVMSIEQAEQP